MKAVLVGPVYPYKGGIAHFTTFLAHSFMRSKHEVEILSFDRLYPLWLYPGVTDKDPSTKPPWPLEAEYLSDPLLPWTWHRMSRRLLEIKPDVVVFQWWTTFFGPMFLYLMRKLSDAGIDVIFLIHNVYPHETRPWHRWISKTLLSRIDKFIVQSQTEHDKLRAIRPKASIVLQEHPLYLWPDLEIIPAAAARQSLKLDPVDPVLLFFGFIRPYKGLENLLYATRILKDRGCSFKLYVVGEFWEEIAKYRRINETLGLEDCVILQDEYIPNELLNQYFSATDIFIAPYQGGTQSGVVKTAIAYDLPIVGSDFLIPASSDFYNPDKHYHIHTLSPEAIADTIEKAFQDDVASKPRILPDWQATGWDQLVDAIATLCDVQREAAADGDAR